MQSVESRRGVTVSAGPRGELQSVSILSVPIKKLDGATTKPLRRISIITTSHDQGECSLSTKSPSLVGAIRHPAKHRANS